MDIFTKLHRLKLGIITNGQIGELRQQGMQLLKSISLALQDLQAVNIPPRKKH
jgi:hypothetical protein